MYEMKNQLLDLGYHTDRIIILDGDYLFPVKKTDNFYNILMDENSRFVLYGTEIQEKEICHLFLSANMKVEAVCSENDRQGKSYCGIPVISLSEYFRYYKDCYMICIGGMKQQMLTAQGVSSDKVIGFANIDRLQYFDDEIVPSDAEHVFVDGGCLDLYTTNLFFLKGREKYKKAYAFEPLKDNFEKCLKNCENWGLDDKVSLYHGALWDKEEDLPLVIASYEGSNLIDEKIDGNKETKNIEIVKGFALDQVLQGDAVTFIKLDIEGSELKALHGMSETIKRYRPVLAIAVYHRPEDIVEIPNYIKSLVPEYKFFLRMYHMDHTEHILYAV